MEATMELKNSNAKLNEVEEKEKEAHK